MFDSYYSYKYKMTKGGHFGQPHLNTRIYTFKSDTNKVYIVDVEEYIGNVFMVKFYLKAHRYSRNKFNLLTSLGRAQKVIFTIIHIMLQIFRERQVLKPSFAFMGANIKYNDGRADESKNNTKRYKFYKKLMAIFFGRDTFDFIEDMNASILILKNQEAVIDLEMDIIIQYIYTNYDILEINLINES